MQLELDTNKSLQENASDYFDKAKKLKKKIEGAKTAIAEHEAKLSKQQEQQEIQQKKVAQKKEWYDKFRWFYSSDGFLVVGGRDATTNDILIKKYTDKTDLVFHTEAPGSPFVVIKATEEIPPTTLQEASDFCASFSKAFKLGLGTTEVYSIPPEQVSKEAKTGEYLKKGAFMIYGKRTYYKGSMNLAIGAYNNKAMVGPLSAIKKHCENFFILVQGNAKLSDVAKKISKKLNLDVDDIVRALPQGMDLKKN